VCCVCACCDGIRSRTITCKTTHKRHTNKRGQCRARCAVHQPRSILGCWDDTQQDKNGKKNQERERERAEKKRRMSSANEEKERQEMESGSRGGKCEKSAPRRICVTGRGTKGNSQHTHPPYSCESLSAGTFLCVCVSWGPFFCVTGG